MIVCSRRYFRILFLFISFSNFLALGLVELHGVEFFNAVVATIAVLSLSFGPKDSGFEEAKKEKRLKGVSDDVKSKVKKVFEEEEEVKIPADFDQDTVKIYTWNVNGIRATISK